MSFIILILSLAVVVIYILWVLFKPKKNPSKKRVSLKKKPGVKNISSAKKQKGPASTHEKTSRKVAEQMKKDPEVISRVVRHWLNER